MRGLEPRSHDMVVRACPGSRTSDKGESARQNYCHPGKITATPFWGVAVCGALEIEFHETQRFTEIHRFAQQSRASHEPRLSRACLQWATTTTLLALDLFHRHFRVYQAHRRTTC